MESLPPPGRRFTLISFSLWSRRKIPLAQSAAKWQFSFGTANDEAAQVFFFFFPPTFECSSRAFGNASRRTRERANGSVSPERGVLHAERAAENQAGPLIDSRSQRAAESKKREQATHFLSVLTQTARIWRSTSHNQA